MPDENNENQNLIQYFQNVVCKFCSLKLIEIQQIKSQHQAPHVPFPVTILAANCWFSRFLKLCFPDFSVWIFANSNKQARVLYRIEMNKSFLEFLNLKDLVYCIKCFPFLNSFSQINSQASWSIFKITMKYNKK